MSIKTKLGATAILSAGLILGNPVPAWAAAGCTAGSSAAAFSVYNPLTSSATTTTATVTVTCQATVQLLVSYTIALSAGASGSVAARTMLNGTSAMSYQIYSDTTHSTIWGDGTGGSQTVTDGYLLSVLTPVVKTYTAYARIPALQNLTPGTYVDTITVLVTY